MSKDNWLAAGSALALVVLIFFFGSRDPHPAPTTAPESIMPLGTFDGSGNFADTLTASSSPLLASPSGATSKPAATSTKPKEAPSLPPGLALALGHLRDALVNIICVSKGDVTRSISGSGVIISGDGLILTNAHVAQLFLLSDFKKSNTVVCVIRTGNPARTAYYAELAYISSPWISKNAASLTLKDPKGTGEDDFALLSVSKSATTEPLPALFPFVSLSSEIPYDKEPVAFGSYGAQTLSTKQIKDFLYPTLVFGTIQDRFTFTEQDVDVLSLGGSAVAQEGSSGGGVVNTDGKLIGVLSTSSVEGDLVSRDLHAITLGHIRRSFLKDTGVDFDTYIARSPTALVANFAGEKQTLATSLFSAISGK